MAKKYRVELTTEERELLIDLIKRRAQKARPVQRAFMLLGADEAEGGLGWPDARIVESYHASVRTVERLRQRFVEEGLEVALYGRRREPTRQKIFDGKVEAHLVALRCSEPPAGYARWTLRLLQDKMIELGYVETISHESVRQLLKKRTQAVARQKLGDPAHGGREDSGGICVPDGAGARRLRAALRLGPTGGVPR